MFKKNLIFIFKFDSKYDDWISYNNPNYDIVLIDAKSRNRWKNISDIYRRYKFFMFFYKTISFVDSDIMISKEKLKKYFDIFIKYKLNFSSPCYKSHDFFSKKNCYMRHVNCLPRKFLTFNFRSLKKSKKFLNINDSGSGVEWVIPKILNYEGVAIIDKVQVGNQYLESKNKIVIKDLVKIYNDFSLENLYNIEFSRVEKDEEKCWCHYIDVSDINNKKFNRPTRRSNGCCEAKGFLSNRMMSSTIEKMQ